MNTKRQKISLLREKVGLMQKDLRAMEKRTGKLAALPQFLKPVHKITHSKIKNRLSQTQRDIPFIFKQSDLFFRKEESRGQKQRYDDKMQTERSLSPILKDIANKLDDSYYIHKKTKADNQCDKSANVSPQRLFQASFVGRRYAHNQERLNRTENFKETKVRTYEAKKTDILLNPEQDKETRRKIVKRAEKSPDQMLQENPNSNRKLYIFDNKPVYMWQKGVTGYKNKSSLEKSRGEVMPSEQANSLEKTTRSQRKHFNRYINEIYSQRPQIAF